MAIALKIAANNSVNFFIYKSLPADFKSTQSCGFFLISAIGSAILHGAEPKIIESTKHWSKEHRFILKKCIDYLPLVLIFASLYHGRMTFFQSAGRALLLDTTHKKLVPDLFNKQTVVNPRKSITRLPNYLLARFAAIISTIQNLFHFSVYCVFQVVGGYKKASLQNLQSALNGNILGEREIETIKQALNSLPETLRRAIFYHVYRIAKPSIDDPNWGENNALLDLGRLQKALDIVKKQPYTFQWEDGLWSKSHRYCLEGTNPASGAIGFVNGMGLHHEEVKNYDANEVRNAYAPGLKMHGVYLATSGKNAKGAIYDYLEAILAMSYQSTGVVREIHKMWDDFFDKNEDGEAEFLHFCASKGTIMTSAALSTYPYPDRIAKIRVIAITPVVYISPEISTNVMHFASLRDFYPYLAPGREKLFDGDPTITIVDAPGSDMIPNTKQLRSAHDLHARPYQDAIKRYLATTRWKSILNIQ